MSACQQGVAQAQIADRRCYLPLYDTRGRVNPLENEVPSARVIELCHRDGQETRVTAAQLANALYYVGRARATLVERNEIGLQRTPEDQLEQAERELGRSIANRAAVDDATLELARVNRLQRRYGESGTLIERVLEGNPSAADRLHLRAQFERSQVLIQRAGISQAIDTLELNREEFTALRDPQAFTDLLAALRDLETFNSLGREPWRTDAMRQSIRLGYVSGRHAVADLGRADYAIEALTRARDASRARMPSIDARPGLVEGVDFSELTYLLGASRLVQIGIGGPDRPGGCASGQLDHAALSQALDEFNVGAGSSEPIVASRSLRWAGCTYQLRGDLDRANARFRSAVELHPSIEAHLSYAYGLTAAGRMPEARSNFAEALRLAQNDRAMSARINYAIGANLMPMSRLSAVSPLDRAEQEQLNEALTFFRAADSDPAYPGGLVGQAAVELRVNQSGSALHRLDQAFRRVGLQPNAAQFGDSGLNEEAADDRAVLAAMHSLWSRAIIAETPNRAAENRRWRNPAIDNADRAVALDAQPEHRRQACLARVRFLETWDDRIQDEILRTYCSNGDASVGERDVLRGLFWLRAANFRSGGDRVRAWEYAFQSFQDASRAVGASRSLEAAQWGALAQFGQRISVYCIGMESVAGFTSQDANAWEARFFSSHQAFACPRR